MNQRVTGETEARAILKGTIRRIQNAGDAILDKRQEQGYIQAKRSAKALQAYHRDNLAWYGDFLVNDYKFRSFGARASKHFRYEYSAIEPELIHAENIGGLCRFIVNFFDSRKYARGKIGAINKFTSQFYFHEHFLIRCIQRLNERSIGEVGAAVYPVIEYMITENLELTRVDDINYFVFRDFIIVAEKLSGRRGMVFKTILLTDKLTDEDERKFAQAKEVLLADKPVVTEAVMTNPKGQVVRRIPPAKGVSLLCSLKKQTFWLQQIWQSEDVRDCEAAL